MKRQDQPLILLAILALLLAVGLLYFDGAGLFGNGSQSDRGEVVGYIEQQNGDVRFKPKSQISWGQPRVRQDLVFNDSIFTGNNSGAIATVKGSKLTLEENTLVVIREDNNDFKLELSYGKFSADLAKDKRVLVDAGPGKKPIVLTPKSNSRLSLQKSSTGQVKIEVVSGSAAVDSEVGTQTIDTQTPFTLATLPPLPERLLMMLEPREPVSLFKGEAVNFRWSDSLSYADQSYTLEFAQDSEFAQIVHRVKATSTDLLSFSPKSSIKGYVRVRSELDVSSAIPFDIQVFERQPAAIAPPLVTSPPPLNKGVLIPNREYPSWAYGSEESATTYLTNNEPDRILLFKSPLETPLELRHNGAILATDSLLPKPMIKPGGPVYFEYRRTPEEPWSVIQKIDVTLVPPRKTLSRGFDAMDSSSTENFELAWTPVLFAHSYDLQMINLQTQERMSFETKRSQQYVKLQPNQPYAWKVRALDKNRRPISQYSPAYPERLRIIKTPLAKAAPAPERQPTNLDSTLTAKKPDDLEQNFQHRPEGLWGWAGTGFNFTNYNQVVPGVGIINDNNIAGPSRFLELGYNWINGFGVVGSFKETPGEVRLRDTNLLGSDYLWRTFSLEALFERALANTTVLGHRASIGARVGFQDHRIPYIQQVGDSTLELRQNQMQTLSLGFISRFDRRRVSYHMTMRYQIPLASSATGANEFTINPNYAFDGLIGASYLLSDRWRVGWFWYGQIHDYAFSYTDDLQTLLGTQSLFYSNMDLRIGYDF